MPPLVFYLILFASVQVGLEFGTFRTGLRRPVGLSELLSDYSVGIHYRTVSDRGSPRARRLRTPDALRGQLA